MSYDAAIIGGGLAGLALAADLGRRGCKVVVVEKGSYPRHKVCGEYISMESYNYLHALCPELMHLQLPVINHFKLSSLGKKEFRTSLAPGGFGISRYSLEDLLYKKALGAGVSFLLNSKADNIVQDGGLYHVRAGENRVTANLVFNAAGRRTNAAAPVKALHQTNYVGVKYHVKISRDPALIEIHNFDGGYCGISSIEENTSCLCYMVNSDNLKRAGSIPELEKQYLFRNHNLERIFSSARFLFAGPLTVSGINFVVKTPIAEGIFYLGDAAGSIAPVTGNGMSMALRSAAALANLSDKYFQKKISRQQLEAAYAHSWSRMFTTRIKLSKYFQRLSEYPMLAGTMISLFNTLPFVARATISQTHGKPF